METDAEPLPGVSFQRPGAHGLTGFGAAKVQRLAARRGGSEKVVEADDAVYFSAGYVERLGHGGNRLGRQIAEFVLNGMQGRQQSSGAGNMAPGDPGHQRRVKLVVSHQRVPTVRRGPRFRLPG